MQMPGMSMGGRMKPVDPMRMGVRTLFDTTTSVPQISVLTEVDLSATVALRAAAKEPFERATGAKLGSMPFFLKAAAKALRAVPEVNALQTPQGLWLHDRVNVGFSLNTPRGTFIPVVADVDQKSVGQIALEMHEKSQRTLQGQFDFTMPTFAVSNPGTHGVQRDVPLVFPPGAGTMTCGAIMDRPWAVNGKVEIRPIMSFTFGFDHRGLDGDEAARFVNAVKSYLENGDYN